MAYIIGAVLPINGSARIVGGADVGTGYDQNMPGYMENVPWHVALVVLTQNNSGQRMELLSSTMCSVMSAMCSAVLCYVFCDMLCSALCCCVH